MPARRPGFRNGPATRRRMSHMRWGAVGLFVLLLLALAGWRWFPLDRTRGMLPDEVARAAGRAVLTAPGYRFEVNLAGAPGDRNFPTSQMRGAYQRRSDVLYLSGRSITGQTEVPLEYYLTGHDLYMREPQDGSWIVLRQIRAETMHTFQPDKLTAPLVSALQAAVVVDRERLPEGEAVVLRLTLDPEAMKSRLGGARPEEVEYRLWVYTRTLRPARLTIRHTPGAQSRVAAYTYELNWQFGRAPRVAVPAEIRSGAREVSGR